MRQTHFAQPLPPTPPQFDTTVLGNAYIQLLVNFITVPDASIRWEGRTVSSASEEVTVAANQGCKFYQRCPHAMDRCLTSPPPVYPVGGGSLPRVICMMVGQDNQSGSMQDG
ncbi:MAG: hypothetical protein ACOYNY_15125 [Caldilineaceae bacterium]